MTFSFSTQNIVILINDLNKYLAGYFLGVRLIQNMVQILTGSIPKELGNMTSMYFLFLPENKLTGTYLRLNVHACRLLSVQNILMDEFLQVKFRVKYSTFHHLN